MTTPERTIKGIKKCAEWLRFCLQLGWSKSQLDALEKLWWEHHDEHGNVIRNEPDSIHDAEILDSGEICRTFRGASRMDEQ